MKNYGFLNTIVLVNGIPINEWMDGDDSFRMSRRSPSFTDNVGVAGDMAVAENADKSGTFVMNLQQTAASNGYLSGLLNAAENSAFVPINVMFKDTKGNDIGTGSSGYIEGHPEMTRGANITGQAWTIVVEQLDMLLGGA
tara:strand:+ start:698 stop:1117 length:420 start_codon:yes stop_codon:yes gene_type:complete